MRQRRSQPIRSIALAVLGLGLLVACEPHPTLPNPLYNPPAQPARDMTGRAPRVLLFGDSMMDIQGSHAMGPLQEAGVDVRIYAIWGSSLFTRGQYDYGQTVPDPAWYEMMAQASSLVAGFDPDIVAVSLNHNYWPPYPRDAQGFEIQEGSAQFTDMARTQLAELVRRLRVNGAQVVLVEPPGSFDAPATASPIWSAYLSVQPDLGFGVIHSGAIVDNADGTRARARSDCGFEAEPLLFPDDEIHYDYFAGGLVGTVLARALGQMVGRPLGGVAAPTDTPVALVPDGGGYRLVTCDGATFPLGTANTTPAGVALGGGRANGDPVAAAAPAAGGGWWEVTERGAVFALGGAPDLGQPTGGGRVVAMASTPSGNGYWLLRVGGLVEARGDAVHHGNAAVPAGAVATALAPTADGSGYWVLTSKGQVFALGSAVHHGDLSAAPPAAPVVDLAPLPDGTGYWILGSTGTVTPFGAAPALGSAEGIDYLRSTGLFQPPQVVPASDWPATAVDLQPTPSGAGYWVVLSHGGVCHFGDAPSRSGIMGATVNPWQAVRGTYLYYDRSTPCSQVPS